MRDVVAALPTDAVELPVTVLVAAAVLEPSKSRAGLVNSSGGGNGCKLFKVPFGDIGTCGWWLCIRDGEVRIVGGADEGDSVLHAAAAAAAAAVVVEVVAVAGVTVVVAEATVAVVVLVVVAAADLLIGTLVVVVAAAVAADLLIAEPTVAPAELAFVIGEEMWLTTVVLVLVVAVEAAAAAAAAAALVTAEVALVKPPGEGFLRGGSVMVLGFGLPSNSWILSATLDIRTGVRCCSAV
jgi:hypothetical protein